ncbi:MULTISPECIES: hypothetical protein [unclassified Acinetobacter]|uniref:hypothetical protein n=1 Tax=unclassified Acinetobacter TaxID=196816 RepID=UPI0035BB20BA
MSNLNQFKALCCDTAKLLNLTDYTYQESISFSFMLDLADSGDVTAQRWVADSYYYGENTQQDLAKAMNWYLRAAIQGDEIAQQFIEICLECSNLSTENANINDWFA